MSESKIFTYDYFIQQFEEAQSQARQLTNSVDEELFLTRPAPKKWSTAECLDHLIQFGNIYYDTINQKLKTSPADNVGPSTAFKPRLPFRGINRFMEPPYKMKFKTISPFQPKQAERSQKEIEVRFSRLQDRFIEQLIQSRQKGLDLRTLKVSNPVVSIIKMTLSECYALAGAHQRRHLWQAEQTLNKIQSC